MPDQPRPSAPPFHSRRWRAGNALVSGLARAGIGPIHLLTTTGSRSGRPHTVPVVPVEHDGRTWLVAPYGAVAWVHNLRARNQARLRYGRDTRTCVTREASADEAGPVLRRYVVAAPKARSQFGAAPGDPVEHFVADANGHPVFELVDVDGETPPATARTPSAEREPRQSRQGSGRKRRGWRPST